MSFQNKGIPDDLSKSFDDLNEQNVDNFSLFGIKLFEGKKKAVPAGFPNGMTDEEAAEVLNRRRAQVAPIIAENQKLIETKINRPKVRAYKSGKVNLPDFLDIIGKALSGESGGERLPPDELAGIPGVDRTTQTNLPNYTAYTQPKKGEKTIFYLIIAVLLIIAIVAVVKKSKK